jgi:hypothetical protein
MRTCTSRCRLRRFEPGLELRDLVAQQQAPLLHATQRELVGRAVGACLVDEGVQIGMLDAQLDQPAGERMQVVVH